MNNDLEYSLGLNTAGFQAGAKQVVTGANDIKKELKGIGDIITAGGVSTVAIGFLREMADWAERSGNKLDDSVQALRRWKAAAEDTGGIKSALADVLAPFIKGGETIGITYRAIFEGISKNIGANSFTMAKNIAEAWVRGVDAHAKSLELDKQQVETGEKIKAALDQQAKKREDIARESARLDEQERSYMLQRMTAQERVNALSNEYLAKAEAIANFHGNEVDRGKLINDYRRLGVELLRAQDDLQKSNTDAAEKGARAEEAKARAAAAASEALQRQADAQERATEAAQKSIASANKSAADQGFDALTPQEQAAINDYYRAKATWEAGGRKGPAPKEPDITRTPSLGQSLSGMRLVSFDGLPLGPARSANDFASVSDAVILEEIRRYNELLQKISDAPLGGAPEIATGGYFRKLAAYQVEQNRAYAQAELDQRNSLRGADFESALRAYKGDPLNFERLYEQANQTYTESKRAADELTKLNDTIRRGGLSVIVMNTRTPGGA